MNADFIAFQLNYSTLPLDSCSTLNVFADGSLLHNIHKVDKHMRVRCNAGVMLTNLMGWFEDFPEPVWYNPDGVANILSMYIMTQHYHVTMDSKRDNALFVSKPDGSALRFAPTGKDLYACVTVQGRANSSTPSRIKTGIYQVRVPQCSPCKKDLKHHYVPWSS
jgi:hypothetical protein